ncbi:hypothetical protein HMPREF1870_01985 [Bacteroidales bacterium KA00344]|nr:hypothetical protein HMPREF1870_01985 [Bacteroidales bacterium KA00344]
MRKNNRFIFLESLLELNMRKDTKKIGYAPRHILLSVHIETKVISKRFSYPNFYIVII